MKENIPPAVACTGCLKFSRGGGDKFLLSLTDLPLLPQFLQFSHTFNWSPEKGAHPPNRSTYTTALHTKLPGIPIKRKNKNYLKNHFIIPGCWHVTLKFNTWVTLQMIFPFATSSSILCLKLKGKLTFHAKSLQIHLGPFSLSFT